MTDKKTSQERLPGELLDWVKGYISDCDGLAPLAMDASSKRYFRPQGCVQGIIAMHAPPPDSITRYRAMQKLVANAGVRAPEIHEWDENRGFALIEDFGDELYDATLGKSPKSHRTLYEKAWVAINKLQKNVVNTSLLPCYDDALLDRELGQFPEWYADGLKGMPLDEMEKEDYAKVCGLLKNCFFSQRQCYVHRDFHSRNLFAIENGPGVIDFSDAVVGPSTYDIASLLRDLYVDIDEEEITDYLVRHWENSRSTGLSPCEDPGEHYRLFDWTSLQRLTKILGQFVRIARQTGKDRFLDYLPKCEQVAHSIAVRYKELRPLAIMIERRAK